MRSAPFHHPDEIIPEHSREKDENSSWKWVNGIGIKGQQNQAGCANCHMKIAEYVKTEDSIQQTHHCGFGLKKLINSRQYIPFKANMFSSK